MGTAVRSEEILGAVIFGVERAVLAIFYTFTVVGGEGVEIRRFQLRENRDFSPLSTLIPAAV